MKNVFGTSKHGVDKSRDRGSVGLRRLKNFQNKLKTIQKSGISKEVELETGISKEE